MYIQRPTNLNFGYNHKINNLVNQKLKDDTETPDMSKHLLEMNKLCMSTENKLRKVEHSNNQDLIDYYTNMLLVVKPIVINEIEDKYPDLNFRDVECDTYRKEAEHKNIKNALDWRFILSEDLQMEKVFLSDTDSSEDFSPLNYMNLAKEELKEIKDLKNKPSTKTNDDDDDNNEQHDIRNLLEKFEPCERSPKNFEDLGGLEQLKEIMEETIVEPVMYPDMAEADKEDYGITLPRGFLLYGPPGCGKTSIVEALSQESGLPLYKLRIGKSGSEFVNKSAKNIETVFGYLSEQYKETGKPSILFMDEVEALAPSRSARNIGKEDVKMVSTLLPLMENARNNGIILVAATNCPDIVEDAVKSRLDQQQYIGLPKDEDRIKILKVHLGSRKKGMALADNDKALIEISKKTQGFSGRTLSILVDEAARIARKDNRRNICAKDFDAPIIKHKDEKINEKKYKVKNDSGNQIGFISM